MCGIVGLISKKNAVPGVLEALKRLEYRGYDSAGIAAEENGKITRQRAPGNISAFEDHLAKNPLSGGTAIGHIRWATHGVVNETNAHPHIVGRVAVVHNGIIENFKELRAELAEAGVAFETETDTEVVAALIDQNLNHLSAIDAVSEALDRLEGAFALGIIIEGVPDTIYAARRGSPLGIGFGQVAGIAAKVSYLEEGDFAVLKPEGTKIFNAGAEVTRDLHKLDAKATDLDKGNYAHYMQKEIFEQPTAISDTLGLYIDPLNGKVDLGQLSFDLKEITKLNLVACGTSYYAALTARYWFETYAGLPVEVEMASEFRYRDMVQNKTELNLFISQSGETLDTLVALRHCQEKGLKTAAIVNVDGSTMTREAGQTFLTHAGVEIGVASTKAYTCQLSVLAALAVAAGRARDILSEKEEAEMVEVLSHLPSRLAEVLYHDEAIQAMAPTLAKAKNVLYLGRGSLYPVAL
jgi:glucosamine--fructose-6-phosphate aminotransferase (isomerizing)